GCSHLCNPVSPADLPCVGWFRNSLGNPASSLPRGRVCSRLLCANVTGSADWKPDTGYCRLACSNRVGRNARVADDRSLTVDIGAFLSASSPILNRGVQEHGEANRDACLSY